MVACCNPPLQKSERGKDKTQVFSLTTHIANFIPCLLSIRTPSLTCNPVASIILIPLRRRRAISSMETMDTAAASTPAAAARPADEAVITFCVIQARPSARTEQEARHWHWYSVTNKNNLADRSFEQLRTRVGTSQPLLRRSR